MIKIKTYGNILTYLLTITLISTAVLCFVMLKKTEEAQNNFDQLNSTVMSKVVELSNLRKTLGYGGAIHDFKNYVLRGEHKKLIDITKNLRLATAAIINYENLGINSKEEAALDEIEFMLKQYSNHLLTIETLIFKKTTPTDIDKLVSVDDSKGLKSLLFLDEHVENLRTQSLKNMDKSIMDATLSIYIATFLIGILILILLGSFYKFIRKRVLNPLLTISRSMQTLSLGDVKASIPYLDQKDEIGYMANSLEIFKDNAIEQENLRTITLQAEKDFESIKAINSIFTSALDCMISIDNKGSIIRINPAGEKLFGYTKEELIGTNVKYLIAEPHQSKHDMYLQHYKSSNKARIIGQGDRRVEGLRKDGSKFFLELSVTESRINSKTNFNGTIKDISERVEAEKMSTLAKEEAVAASNAKSNFLANMSHEIRTPMNGIVGMTQMLAETTLTDEQKSTLRNIEISTDSLLNIINDILDFSKIEAGKLDVENIHYDIEALAEEVIDFTSIRCDCENVNVILRIDPDMPKMLVGDPYRIRQVVMNLLTNSAKFTKNGHIILDIETQENNKKPEILISVKDTGIGIPEENISSLFTTFTQVDTSTTRNYGGSGLGLAICKQLVMLMGGNIHVESEVGKGSNFYFTLPFKTPKKGQKQSTPEHKNIKKDVQYLKKHKIIILDENEMSNLVICGKLITEGLDIRSVTTVEDFEKKVEKNNYDIALVDFNIFSNTDITFMEQKKYSDLSLILISYVQPNLELKEFHQAGFSGYLQKPLHLSKIIPLMKAVLIEKEKDINKQNFITRASITNFKGVKKENHHTFTNKALLVDDIQMNRIISKALLESLGCDVIEAKNGIEALDIYKKGDVDIIFMDCQMPEMDGFEASMEIRKIEKEAEKQPIPIVALSASAMKEDIEKCLKSGMNSHIAKPVKKKNFIKELRRFQT